MITIEWSQMKWKEEAIHLWTYEMMKYLEWTVDLELTLDAHPENEILWVCGTPTPHYFEVQPDMKSHTSVVATTGRGAMSAKAETDTRSFAEPVSADESGTSYLNPTIFCKPEAMKADQLIS